MFTRESLHIHQHTIFYQHFFSKIKTNSSVNIDFFFQTTAWAFMDAKLPIITGSEGKPTGPSSDYHNQRTAFLEMTGVCQENV
jgi:hypothetical protein